MGIERHFNTCGLAVQLPGKNDSTSDMQIAKVIGNATATVKHASLSGWRLIALQPLDIDNKPDGFPLLAIDNHGVGKGDMVFFTSDGKQIRKMVGREDCPIRFAVQGMIDG